MKEKTSDTVCAGCGHYIGVHALDGCKHCDCEAFRKAPAEFNCPRRAEGFGIPTDGPSDYWAENRWTKGRDPDYFPEGVDQPRTCSYCGGVNPDDAIGLIESGWESEGTGKSYKRYLHPKGYRAAQEAFIASIGLPGGTSDSPRIQSPTPPVKLYTPHFTAEQIAAFNRAIDGPS
jgi:hypothetical protein